MTTHDQLVNAVLSGDDAAVVSALASGASCDERTSDGRTALMLACTGGNIKIVTALLEAGASPNRRTTEREETVLHQLARRTNSADIMGVVLKHRCHLDRKDRFGWTALMVAAHKGSSEAATALLAAGADPAITCPDGRSAKQLAQDGKHQHVSALL